MSGGDVVIDVEHLTKKFGDKTVVNDVSLTIRRGKIYGFLGPNGSGKTTTIRMLCGILTPSDGHGTCLGLNLRTEAFRIRERIGYMTQKFSFWDDLTVRENLAFVADIFRIKDPTPRIDATLHDLGLTHRADQLAGTLSGGWKQRLALAACTLHRPEILLLDEPTAGVDPKARKEFWQEIRQFADVGMSILVSTHYMDEANRCDEIIYIAYGDVVAKGSIDSILTATGKSNLEEAFIYYMDRSHAEA